MSLSRKKKQGAALLLPDRSAHIGKSFHGLRKICNVFFCVSVLYTVAHTVPDMPFQYDLSATMQRGFGGVELRGDILAGYVLIDHPVNGLHLSDDFFNLRCRLSASIHCRIVLAFLLYGVVIFFIIAALDCLSSGGSVGGSGMRPSFLSVLPKAGRFL